MAKKAVTTECESFALYDGIVWSAPPFRLLLSRFFTMMKSHSRHHKQQLQYRSLDCYKRGIKSEHYKQEHIPAPLRNGTFRFYDNGKKLHMKQITFDYSVNVLSASRLWLFVLQILCAWASCCASHHMLWSVLRRWFVVFRGNHEDYNICQSINTSHKTLHNKPCPTGLRWNHRRDAFCLPQRISRFAHTYTRQRKHVANEIYVLFLFQNKTSQHVTVWSGLAMDDGNMLINYAEINNLCYIYASSSDVFFILLSSRCKMIAKRNLGEE